AARRRPEPETEHAQQRPRRHIDEMMLIGGEHRNADQQRPAMQQPVESPRHVSPIEIPENDQQRDMQRWRLVVGSVESRQRIEQETEKARRLGLGESQAQGKYDEAGDRDRLRRQQASPMGIQFVAGSTEKERGAIEEIDRPIRNDRPIEERDPSLP